MRPRALLAAAGAIALLARSPLAKAEVREAVERVAEAWRARGASVAVDRSRFLNDDGDEPRPVVVALPDLPDGPCTTVLLLGARGLGFHVRAPGNEGDDATGRRFPSIAGMLTIESCGDSVPRRLVVTSDSGRGALEVVVARSFEPLPTMRVVLPERAAGTAVPMADPGALPPLPTPQKRAEVAEVRAKRDGAVIATRETWRAGVDGIGTGQLELEPGCHTFQLFAVDPRTSIPAYRSKLDLDAEMRDASDDRLLARDRTDAPDAQLVACVGEATRADIVFAGSPPGGPVLVGHFAWALPEHLPALWGQEVRGRMARVLRARHVASLLRDPVLLAQGGSGTTPVPLPLEPGGCYVAMTARVREAAHGLGLRVHVGSIDASDDRGIDGDGAAVAFCAGDRTEALAEIEARGAPSLGWGFALYRLQSGVWRPRGED